jgi:hypothetical protein
MQNLAQLTEQIKEEYSNLHSYDVLSKDISLTEEGYLNTGKNKFLVRLDGLDQLAEKADIRKKFLRRLPLDVRAMLFNCCFQMAISDGKVPRDMRINLSSDAEVTGFDDPTLLRISPVQLIDVICRSLPEGLSPKQISVGRFSSTPRWLWISCFSPEIVSEPRPHDIINGGIDVVHYLSGDKGTQINCYLRRLVCLNGATAHICGENRQLRARRLHNGRFDEADMLDQMHRLLTEAWAQLNDKLDAIKGLLGKDRMPIEFLRQQRTKFSLNDRVLSAIERAIREDELGWTDTQYDIFNALSRVATHEQDLTFRQQRTLNHMAGEFSQQTAHRCDTCGQWVVNQGDVREESSAVQEDHQPE